MIEKPVVAIFRDHLLSPSETFITGQAETLREFVPYYIGSRRVPGLRVPTERTLVVNGGGLPGMAKEAAFKLLGTAPDLVRRLRGLNPELVHAHFGLDGVKALPLARAIRVPLLVTFHGYDATVTDEHARRSFHAHRAYLRHRETLGREARLLIAVSEFVKRRLVDGQGFPPEKILVHYIGVDVETFRPDPTVSREPVVLFVGRLVEKKGCEYLIRAMSKVQALMPRAELVVIGEGPDRSALERLAGETLRRYRFLGLQPPESVRAWMNRARVFSVPSVTAESGDSEGFGIVFAEAQAMGTPVASFVSGGIPEAVAHGETGFLAPERDWERLANDILLLLGEDALWRRFSEAGQNRVRTSFDLRRQTGLLEEIYGRVLDEGTAGRNGDPSL